MKATQLLLIATSCVVLILTATAQTLVLLRTFNNPAPEGGDHFGLGMVALGDAPTLKDNMKSILAISGSSDISCPGEL